jgi:hypothetical protein
MFIVMRRKFNKYDPATFRLFKTGSFRKLDYGDRVQAAGFCALVTTEVSQDGSTAN